MSHTVKIKAQFKTQNLESFKRAIEHFGWKLVENSKIRTYRGDPGRETIYPMIGLNPENGFDVGIQFNQETGELEVLGDFYDGSISKTLGKDLDKLKQEYACCVAEDQLAYMGYSAMRQAEQDGTISIYAEEG